MRLSRLLMVFIGLSAMTASAQVGVYLMATGNHLSDISNATIGGTGTKNSSFSPLGVTFGGYYDFKKFGPVLLGADFRGSLTQTKKGPFPELSGAEGRVRQVLGGVRGSFPFPVKHIHPYLQVSAGYVSTNYGLYAPTYAGGNNMKSNLGVDGFLGADVTLAPAVALRLEGGTGFISGGNPSGTYPLQNFSVGLVLRFPRTN